MIGYIKNINVRLLLWRFAMTVLGAFMTSFAIAIFKTSNFGVDPFQCLSMGVYKPFQNVAPYGLWYMGWSFVILLIDLFLDRKLLGLATSVHLFITGYIVQWGLNLIGSWFPDPSLPVRIGMLVVGIVVMCLGASLYFVSDLGVSVYDCIALALERKSATRHKIPHRYFRIACDVLAVLGGMAFGLMPGIGTLITAFFMGPLIDLFKKTVAAPILKIGKKLAKVPENN